MIYKKHKYLENYKANKELGFKDSLLQEFTDDSRNSNGFIVSASDYLYLLDSLKDGQFITNRKSDVSIILNKYNRKF